MKKQDKNKSELIDGQISIFDLKITEKPKKVTKEEEKVTEIEVFVTESLSKITHEENEKSINSLAPTENQQRFLDKNNIIENENLSRVIKYCGGGLGIELVYENSYKTIYINTDGKEEFTIEKKSPVLPMDKILYYKASDIPLNSIQEEKLKNLLERMPFKRVVHRKGDENILVELEDGIVSITPIGWELPFESINNIECSEDEIYLVSKEVPEETVEKDSVEVQERVKVGDYVQAMHGKELIEGEIISEYGLGNEVLNIIFADGTKHTAIGRRAVKKILKSA